MQRTPSNTCSLKQIAKGHARTFDRTNFAILIYVYWMAIPTLEVRKPISPETPEFETCPYDPQICTRNLLMPEKALERVYCLKSKHPGVTTPKLDPNSTSIHLSSMI